MTRWNQETDLDLLQELRALLGDERDPIANAANMSALLFQRLPKINWVGFYFLRGDELVLGPFQGKPACVRIASGRGVCGQAVLRRRTLVVPDVHAFPGHIACDSASCSEVVIPLFHQDEVIGVLDIDSPVPNRFGPEEAACLEQLVASYLELSDVERSTHFRA